MSIILLIIGFFLLIQGARFLVNGASSLARKMNVSDLVVGLTIVAFGTSMPELFVNIFASIEGNADIAIGNILGSNIANILLILGISAIVYPLAVKTSTVWREIPLSILAVLMVGILGNDAFIDKMNFSIISRGDGLVLISFFIIFLYYAYGIAKIEVIRDGLVEEDKVSMLKAIIMTIAGIALLAIGGKFVVDSAVKLAEMMGISQLLIASTIVAVGTSLPELATSVVAAYKKKADIAIGNVVGSNIFNIFWVLGLSAVIRPLPFKEINNFSIAAIVVSSILLFLFMHIRKKPLLFGSKYELKRWHGITFLLLYIGYVVYFAMANGSA